MPPMQKKRDCRVIVQLTADEADALRRMAEADRRPAAALARLILVDAMIAAGELAAESARGAS